MFFSLFLLVCNSVPGGNASKWIDCIPIRRLWVRYFLIFFLHISYLLFFLLSSLIFVLLAPMPESSTLVWTCRPSEARTETSILQKKIPKTLRAPSIGISASCPTFDCFQRVFHVETHTHKKKKSTWGERQKKKLSPCVPYILFAFFLVSTWPRKWRGQKGGEPDRRQIWNLETPNAEPRWLFWLLVWKFPWIKKWKVETFMIFLLSDSKFQIPTFGWNHSAQSVQNSSNQNRTVRMEIPINLFLYYFLQIFTIWRNKEN
jgi:hypothetical protein